jgi:hypothetical protein
MAFFPCITTAARAVKEKEKREREIDREREREREREKKRERERDCKFLVRVVKVSSFRRRRLKTYFRRRRSHSAALNSVSALRRRLQLLEPAVGEDPGRGATVVKSNNCSFGASK